MVMMIGGKAANPVLPRPALCFCLFFPAEGVNPFYCLGDGREQRTEGAGASGGFRVEFFYSRRRQFAIFRVELRGIKSGEDQRRVLGKEKPTCALPC